MFRQRMDGGLVEERFLGVAAGFRTHPVHPISCVESFDICANGNDNARSVASGRVRKVGLGGVGSGADVGVHRIDAGGANLH